MSSQLYSLEDHTKLSLNKLFSLGGVPRRSRHQPIEVSSGLRLESLAQRLASSGDEAGAEQAMPRRIEQRESDAHVGDREAVATEELSTIGKARGQQTQPRDKPSGVVLCRGVCTPWLVKAVAHGDRLRERQRCVGVVQPVQVGAAARLVDLNAER
mgnify:CR=1 FL=1